MAVSMPIGAFVDHSVAPTCGMLGLEGAIGPMDDPITFYEPRRYEAQLVWFAQGMSNINFPIALETVAVQTICT